MTDVPRTLPQRKKTISVDFDGVIHGYQSGWKGATVIPDPPVPGALEFLMALHAADFDIVIFSSRSHELGAIEAMQVWLIRHLQQLEFDNVGVVLTTAKVIIKHFVRDIIQWPQHKPPAHVSIDDRGWRFEGPGHWPTMDELRNFKTWMQK
jgi:hypothetical protein